MPADVSQVSANQDPSVATQWDEAPAETKFEVRIMLYLGHDLNTDFRSSGLLQDRRQQQDLPSEHIQERHRRKHPFSTTL